MQSMSVHRVVIGLTGSQLPEGVEITLTVNAANTLHFAIVTQEAPFLPRASGGSE